LGYDITENMGLLGGVGMGYKGDQRIYMGIKFKF